MQALEFKCTRGRPAEQPASLLASCCSTSLSSPSARTSRARPPPPRALLSPSRPKPRCCSYEEASPRAKRAAACATPPPASAPWRVILRDQSDDMVFCMRGLPLHLRLDQQLRLMTWGPSVAVAFPTAGRCTAPLPRLAPAALACCVP